MILLAKTVPFITRMYPSERTVYILHQFRIVKIFGRFRLYFLPREMSKGNSICMLTQLCYEALISESQEKGRSCLFSSKKPYCFVAQSFASVANSELHNSLNHLNMGTCSFDRMFYEKTNELCNIGSAGEKNQLRKYIQCYLF